MKGGSQKGISLVEVLIGVSILALSIVFIAHTLTLFLSSSGVVLEKTQATYLAEEGLETLRYLRDEDWNTIADLGVGATYYLDIATTTVATTTTPEVIDSLYTRSFEVGEVFRDGNDDLAASGALDAGSRYATVTIAWGGESVSLTTLLTNIYDI